MNKNTLLAFALIVLAAWFFYSPFYYHKILRQPHPSEIQKKTIKPSLAHSDSASHAEADEEPTTAGHQARPAVGVGADDGARTANAEWKETVAELASLDAGDTTIPNWEDAETLWVETPRLVCGISSLGARIVTVRTKEYRDKVNGGEWIELIPAEGGGGANVAIDSRSYDSTWFALSGETQERGERIVIGAGEDRTVQFRGGGITKSFDFAGGSYVVGCRIEGATVRGSKVYLGWESGITESEDGHKASRGGYQEMRRVHFSDGKSIEHREHKKVDSLVVNGYYRWIGVTSKYFLCGLIADETADMELQVRSRLVGTGEEQGKGKKQKEYNYGIGLSRYVDDTSAVFSLYAGPSQLEELKSPGVGLHKALFGSPDGSFSNNFGKVFVRADVWFPYVCEFVLWLLIVLQKGLKDYGIVIIVLTLLSKVVTFPLTHSSTRSMGKMKDLQPKINAIRQRYKSNPRKMNEEIMALYKTEGVNPFNPGCLPMFLQMPVFFALFVVLRRAIELRGAKTVLIPWISDLSQAEALPVVTDLFQSVFKDGLPMYGNTVGLLPIVMGVLMYFQNKMTIKDPNQKAMIYFMPVFMTVLFNSFSSGLVLYWTFSSVVQLLQQYITERLKKSRKDEVTVIPGRKPGTKRAKTS